MAIAAAIPAEIATPKSNRFGLIRLSICSVIELSSRTNSDRYETNIVRTMPIKRVIQDRSFNELSPIEIP